MKKLFSIAAVFAAVTFGVNAQEQGQFGANISVALGSEAGIDEDNGESTFGTGVTVGVEYFATDVISIAPSFTYFFPNEIDLGIAKSESNLSSINIDGRYYFLTDGLNVYGLAGIGIVGVSGESTIDFLGVEETVEIDDSETGVNIGAGAIIPISDNFGILGQVKYNTAYDGQLVINIGTNLRF